MNEEKIKSEYLEFQNEHEGFGNLMVLNNEGQILFSLDPNFASKEEGKALMDAWLNNKSAIKIGEKRYPILSWEEIQFAARNVKDKDALIGCKVKSKNYVVVHLEKGAKISPAIASIALNRWSWDKI